MAQDVANMLDLEYGKVLIRGLDEDKYHGMNIPVADVTGITKKGGCISLTNPASTIPPFRAAGAG